MHIFHSLCYHDYIPPSHFMLTDLLFDRWGGRTIIHYSLYSIDLKTDSERLYINIVYVSRYIYTKIYFYQHFILRRNLKNIIKLLISDIQILY